MDEAGCGVAGGRDASAADGVDDDDKDVEEGSIRVRPTPPAGDGSIGGGEENEVKLFITVGVDCNDGVGNKDEEEPPPTAPIAATAVVDVDGNGDAAPAAPFPLTEIAAVAIVDNAPTVDELSSPRYHCHH